MQKKLSDIFHEYAQNPAYKGLFREIQGPDCEIRSIRSIHKGDEHSLVFLSDKRYLPMLQSKKVGAVVSSPKLALRLDPKQSVLISDNVSLAMALLKQSYMDRDFFATEWTRIHPSAVIHESAEIAKSAAVGPLVVIGAGVRVAERVAILAGAIIERDVRIGARTIIHPRVCIGYSCLIGEDVIIKTGAVIGSEGFGFAQNPQEGKKNVRIPQTGRVVIGNRVVIGALNTIDRAAFDETRIDDGVIMDNLCHVAHNCHIGENSIIIAQCGISGTTTIGKRVILSGQTGTLDHVNIPDDTVLVHRAGAVQSIPKSGVYAGLPPQPLDQYLRNTYVSHRIADLNKKVKHLEKQLMQKEEK